MSSSRSGQPITEIRPASPLSTDCSRRAADPGSRTTRSLTDAAPSRVMSRTSTRSRPARASSSTPAGRSSRRTCRRCSCTTRATTEAERRSLRSLAEGSSGLDVRRLVVIRLVRRFGVVVLLAVVGTVGALGAFATTAASQPTPACKPAQKSTKAKPCIRPAGPARRAPKRGLAPGRRARSRSRSRSRSRRARCRPPARRAPRHGHDHSARADREYAAAARGRQLPRRHGHSRERERRRRGRRQRKRLRERWRRLPLASEPLPARRGRQGGSNLARSTLAYEVSRSGCPQETTSAGSRSRLNSGDTTAIVVAGSAR